MKTTGTRACASIFLAGTLTSCNWLFDLRVDPLAPASLPQAEAGAPTLPGDGGSEGPWSATSSTDTSGASSATQATSSSWDTSSTLPTDSVTLSPASSSGSADYTSDTWAVSPLDGGNDAEPPFVTDSTDGTSDSTASPSSCGDGFTDDGETCDDRNRDDFDGCSAACREERWSLQVNGVLSPVFDVDTTEYAVKLPLFVDVLRLSGASPEGTHLSVEGTTLGDGTWTSGILPLGETLVRLNVVRGEEVVRTYRLRVTRGQPVELYFKASNTGSGDTFGESVALSGDGSTLAVGAKTEDGSIASDGGANSDELAADAGAVYVFQRSAQGVWVQEAYLKSLNIAAGDRFGDSVSLSADGQTLAVGASAEGGGAREISNSTNSPRTRPNSGAAYVFVRDGGLWQQQVYIKASNADEGDSFGQEVELSADGNTLAVTAPSEAGSEGGVSDGRGTNNGTPGSGAAYVFVRNQTGAWAQQAYIKADTPGYMDFLGESLALSGDGDTLAVGAHWANHIVSVEEPVDAGDAGPIITQLDNSGAAYVFRRSASGVWAQEAHLEGSNLGETFQFGFSVALSHDGNILAVGANQEDLNLPPPGGDTSSSDIRWNGGAVYMFMRDNETWTQDAYLTAHNAGNNDYFGFDVSLNAAGTMLAVGAYEEDGSGTLFSDGSSANNASADSGAVYMFVHEEWWTQSRYVKAVNTGEFDYFGANVALSADGTTLAVGAYNEENIESGLAANPNVNGASLAGAAYIVQ